MTVFLLMKSVASLRVVRRIENDIMFGSIRKFFLQLIAGANLATIFIMLFVGYSDRLDPVKHAVLANLTDSVRGWLYAYAYPSNCLAVRFIYNEAGASIKESEREEFEICITNSGNQAICCNIPNALMEYTVNVVDSNVKSVF